MRRSSSLSKVLYHDAVTPSFDPEPLEMVTSNQTRCPEVRPVADILLYDHRSSICSQMARLALVEKGLTFSRRQIDIMETNEQFEPWYIAINPKAVVPTLQVDGEITTDTLRIVNRVDMFDGPDLAGDNSTQQWLIDIMALHYGVLLYRNRLDQNGVAPQIVVRGEFLASLAVTRPDLDDLLSARRRGNANFQALLKDPDGINEHLQRTRDLVEKMILAVNDQPYLAGQAYSLADCFATAALARFTIHGFSSWWENGPLEDYYARMKSRESFEVAEVVETGTERDL